MRACSVSSCTRLLSCPLLRCRRAAAALLPAVLPVDCACRFSFGTAGLRMSAPRPTGVDTCTQQSSQALAADLRDARCCCSVYPSRSKETTMLRFAVSRSQDTSVSRESPCRQLCIRQ